MSRSAPPSHAATSLRAQSVEICGREPALGFSEQAGFALTGLAAVPILHIGAELVGRVLRALTLFLAGESLLHDAGGGHRQAPRPEVLGKAEVDEERPHDPPGEQQT